MKTLVQAVFGNTIDHKPRSSFSNSKLEEASKELRLRLELKRIAEMSVDEKIAKALMELKQNKAKTASRGGLPYGALSQQTSV